MVSKEKIFGTAYHIAIDLHAVMNGAFIGAGIALNEPLLVVMGLGFAGQGEGIVFLHNRIDQKLDEHIAKHGKEAHNDTQVIFQDGEPIPPDPDKATQEQIDDYKAAVLNAGFTPPNESDKNETPHE